MNALPELQSRVISLLRLPLMVLVVLIHAQLGDAVDGGIAFQGTQFLLSNVIARTSVPLFFIISGYLFFFGKDFTVSIYLEKLKRRIRTLLIPYLLWNLLILLILLTVQTFIPSLQGESKPINSYNLTDWANTFGIGTHPIDAPLWFLRDLIVMVLISPIIYWAIRLLRWGWVALLALPYFFCESNFFALSAWWITPLFYFSIGSTLSIRKHLLINIPRSLFLVAATIMLITCFGLVIDLYPNFVKIASKLCWISECVVILWLTNYFCLIRPSMHAIPFLSGFTFFLFGFHYKPQQVIIEIYEKSVSAMSTQHCFILYFGNFFAIILLSAILYWLCKRLFPRLANLLTGSR